MCAWDLMLAGSCLPRLPGHVSMMCWQAAFAQQQWRQKRPRSALAAGSSLYCRLQASHRQQLWASISHPAAQQQPDAGQMLPASCKAAPIQCKQTSASSCGRPVHTLQRSSSLQPRCCPDAASQL
jgi:hypothetical protein